MGLFPADASRASQPERTSGMWLLSAFVQPTCRCCAWLERLQPHLGRNAREPQPVQRRRYINAASATILMNESASPVFAASLIGVVNGRALRAPRRAGPGP